MKVLKGTAEPSEQELGRVRLQRLRKNTKFGNRITLVSSGKSATNAGSENELIRQMVPKMRFSATSSSRAASSA